MNQPTEIFSIRQVVIKLLINVEQVIEKLRTSGKIFDSMETF